MPPAPIQSGPYYSFSNQMTCGQMTMMEVEIKGATTPFLYFEENG